MVAGKPDPTSGRFRFRCNFQTVRNLEKKDHENEFRGSKNGGKELWGGRKLPEMAEKVKNSPVITVVAAAASPSRSGRVRPRLAVKFGRVTVRRLCTSLSGACSFLVAGGASSGPVSHGSLMSKRSNSVPGLESSFLGFLEFKKCLGG